MFNFQLSSRPNENQTVPIENPILDQFDLLNDFENLEEKVDSMAIISHELPFLKPDPDNLDTIYEVDSEKKNISKSSEFSEVKTSFSNIPLKEENSLSQISEFFLFLSIN